MVGQPGLAAPEDHGGALPGDDHDADGHRDEHGGNRDVDDDQREVLDVAEAGFAYRGHGQKREYESLRPSEAEESSHREGCCGPNMAESREDRARTAPLGLRARGRMSCPEPEGQQRDPEEEGHDAFYRLVRVEPLDCGLAENQAETARDPRSEQEPAERSDAVRGLPQPPD